MLFRRGIVFALVVLAGSLALPAAATGLSVEGTSFVLRQEGRVLRSPDLVGAELDLGDGNVLRIDAVRTDPQDPTIFLHSFSTRDAVSDWQNPCDADASGKREGFPLPGRWDANGAFHPGTEHFALTCTSGAQAKCIRFGYKPWKQSKDGQSLLPLYEACIRMVRADYCGTGEATTLDGTEIDIYDDRSIQHPEAGPEFLFEAGWSPQGAVCVNHTRIPKNITTQALASHCPRLANALGQACDEATARKLGAVLFNRSR